MMHRIRIPATLPEVRAHRRVIRSCVREVIRRQNVRFGCLAEIFFIDDERMELINTQHRGVASTTDVLSFPNFDFEAGERPVVDPDNGRVYLGYILISLERAEKQAALLGHSLERELGYLTTHAALHLFGYDHERTEEQQTMRDEEEAVMQALGLTR